MQVQTVIEIECRSVYGNRLIYPANEAARTLALIARTRTLSPQVIEQAKSLGFEVCEVFTPMPVQS